MLSSVEKKPITVVNKTPIIKDMSRKDTFKELLIRWFTKTIINRVKIPIKSFFKYIPP